MDHEGPKRTCKFWKITSEILPRERPKWAVGILTGGPGTMERSEGQPAALAPAAVAPGAPVVPAAASHGRAAATRYGTVWCQWVGPVGRHRTVKTFRNKKSSVSISKTNKKL